MANTFCTVGVRGRRSRPAKILALVQSGLAALHQSEYAACACLAHKRSDSHGVTSGWKHLQQHPGHAANGIVEGTSVHYTVLASEPEHEPVEQS